MDTHPDSSVLWGNSSPPAQTQRVTPRPVVSLRRPVRPSLEACEPVSQSDGEPSSRVMATQPFSYATPSNSEQRRVGGWMYTSRFTGCDRQNRGQKRPGMILGRPRCISVDGDTPQLPAIHCVPS